MIHPSLDPSLMADHERYEVLGRGSDGALFIKPSCGHCKTVYSLEHRLKYCNVCVEQWYCDAECQRSHWKEHKAICHASRRADLESGKTMDIKDAVEAWAERYTRALTQAGSEVLLPSKRDPNRSLIHTHALDVIVRPMESSPGDFEVQSASKVNLAQIRMALDAFTPGKFAGQNAAALSSAKGLEAAKGKGVEGIMRFTLQCEDPTFLASHLVVTSKEVVEQRRMVEGREDWVERLKVFTAPGVKDYKVGEHGELMAVKKLRTRRTKAREPATERTSPEIQHLTPMTLAAPVTRWWADIVDDDDGELPDLSDWGV